MLVSGDLLRQMDAHLWLVLAADEASATEAGSLRTVLVVKSRVLRRARLILPRRNKVNAHVKTYILSIPAV